MKKLTTTLLFTAFSLLAFAQSSFTEKIFTDMMGRYQKETATWLTFGNLYAIKRWLF
jgi:hypothetical protein